MSLAAGLTSSDRYSALVISPSAST